MTTSLVLKRASTSRPDGQWNDNDFDVLADGKVVGRILQENTSGPSELRWVCSLMVTPAPFRSRPCPKFVPCPSR
jgi:hypothetical protein